jgi:hypothetical protein
VAAAARRARMVGNCMIAVVCFCLNWDFALVLVWMIGG